MASHFVEMAEERALRDTPFKNAEMQGHTLPPKTAVSFHTYLERSHAREYLYKKYNGAEYDQLKAKLDPDGVLSGRPINGACKETIKVNSATYM